VWTRWAVDITRTAERNTKPGRKRPGSATGANNRTYWRFRPTVEPSSESAAQCFVFARAPFLVADAAARNRGLMNATSEAISSTPTLLRSRRFALIAVLALVGAMSIVGIGLTPSPAQAANVAIDQCNNRNAGPGGATTAMVCTVTVVNTISGGTTSSSVTVERLCAGDPCDSGNGTFVTNSNDLVTSVTQCNGSGNDAAHTTTCTVTITNNISADTPGAQPVKAL